mgnify:CR=1 FL=1
MKIVFHDFEVLMFFGKIVFFHVFVNFMFFDIFLKIVFFCFAWFSCFSSFFDVEFFLNPRAHKTLFRLTGYLHVPLCADI